jgi:hypothetical protein
MEALPSYASRMHLHLILVAVVALGVFLLIRNQRSKRVRVALSSSSPAIDRWLREELAGILAKKLADKGLERAHIASTLSGDPDGAVVAEIEQAVRAIEIEYVRDPSTNGNLDVRARIRFHDGNEENLTTHIAYTEAPASVREDFERKATTRAFRKWDFPWMNAH